MSRQFLTNPPCKSDTAGGLQLPADGLQLPAASAEKASKMRPTLDENAESVSALQDFPINKLNFWFSQISDTLPGKHKHSVFPS